MRPQQWHVMTAIVERDHVAVYALFEYDGTSTRADVLAYQRVVGIHRDIADRLGLGVIGHCQAEPIVGVEHGGIGGDFDRQTLDRREFLERVDAAQSEMVGADIETCRHIAGPEAEAAAQHATACSL